MSLFIGFCLGVGNLYFAVSHHRKACRVTWENGWRYALSVSLILASIGLRLLEIEAQEAPQ